MKKVLITMFAMVSLSSLYAQYKKASFFEKEGRTYALTAEGHFLGDGRETAAGFTASFGRDAVGKRFFSFTDVRVIPSYRFSYETEDSEGNTILLAGKSKLHLIYGINLGYYLRNNEDEKQIFKPYVTAGINVVILGGLKEYDDDEKSYNALKIVPESGFSSGLSAGAGTIINLNSFLGIKLEGGYIYQFSLNPFYDRSTKLYHLYAPHPYASAGLRFRISSE